jgi:hypothetical protein
MSGAEPRPKPLRACPSCSSPMQRQSFARKPMGSVDLDLCFGCQAIWFDQHESAQLTPGAVLDLFRTIHEHSGAPARPLADRMRCLVCNGALKLTHDIQRTNRISYYRCAESHGRFTTFFQFLREKNFVRSLTIGEIEQLKVHVSQVRCSNCGGPVNVERDAACSYCRSPISILDADAVSRTLAELSEQEQRRKHVDPHAAVDALLAGQRVRRNVSQAEMPAYAVSMPLGVDLVFAAIDFLMSP